MSSVSVTNVQSLHWLPRGKLDIGEHLGHFSSIGESVLCYVLDYYCENDLPGEVINIYPSLESTSDKPKLDSTKVQLGEAVHLLGLLTEHGERFLTGV